MMIDKARIRTAFNRAAREYDAIAQFQRDVCEHLLRLIPRFLPGGISPDNILDAGSGTGYGALLMKQKWPKASLAGCDLSLEMSRLARQNGLHTVCGDIENLPFKQASFDLIWSSLVFQWCHQEKAYRELARALTEEGVMLFATLESGTLHELDSAFSGPGTYRHVLSFSSAAQIEKKLQQSGFSRIQLLQETWITEHPDLSSLLVTIRGIGANQVGNERRRSLMGKGVWRTAQARYESLRLENGQLPATYKLVFGCAEK